MAKIISLINQKGGVGKTESTKALAFEASKHGYKTLMIDTDPQQSLSLSISRRKDALPHNLYITSSNLDKEIPRLCEDYDLAFIDTPGNLSNMTTSVILCSCLAIVPCTPSYYDLDASRETVRLISRLQTIREGVLNFVMFLSRARALTNIGPEISSGLQEIENDIGKPITVLKSVITNRVIFQNCTKEGLIVQEEEPNGKAAFEYAALFNELMKYIRQDHDHEI